MISPEQTYNSFTFINNNIWTIPGPLSGNLVAGIMAGIKTVISSMIDTPEHISIGLSIGDTVLNYDITDVDNIDNISGNYILTLSSKQDIQKSGNETDGRRIFDNYYGWWIQGTISTEIYELYAFNNVEFIQGFISICNAFNVDFRDFIFGPPFRVEKDIIYYNIQGYDIEPIPQIRPPAPIGPFYIDRDEADPNAEDYI